ncbi:class I SAM-dependent DNA methyltransferase [Actinoallomurus iriomotensis]|uniref:class I SAM-dependent DNA methyltransferase n=1 Tax=Actinoallomurus iriomotensis TaxID=478107 RepID=UPI002557AA0C|nr:class I SAM-dependent methyltransferase [Actinoallomurus iriomotensis]
MAQKSSSLKSAPHLSGDSVRDLYDALAVNYDADTRRNDYDVWVAMYQRLISRYGAPGNRLVDLGSGTGKAAIRFAASGYAVTGVDISPEMLRIAQARPGAERVRFAVADLRRLPDLGEFDVAVALGEPFDYLRNEEELGGALRGVANLLAPGGLLVFDINTHGHYERFSRTLSVDEREDMLMIWRGSRPARDGKGADLRVDRFATDDGTTWRRSAELHSWSYFAPPTVSRLLLATGYAELHTYGLFDGELNASVDEQRDRKRIVVARKPEPPR